MVEYAVEDKECRKNDIGQAKAAKSFAQVNLVRGKQPSQTIKWSYICLVCAGVWNQTLINSKANNVKIVPQYSL